MVINQVHVHRLAPDKAEDNAPVARNAHAPLPTPVALQRMQPVAGQFHVLGRLRRRQFRQDATDTAGQVLRHQSGIVPFGYSLQSFVRTLNATQYASETRLVASLSDRLGKAPQRMPGGSIDG